VLKVLKGKQLVTKEDQIIIDSKEPREMKEHLEDLGWEAIKESLKVGDYVRGDTVIERKEIGDFVGSLKDGRLFKQAKNMQDNYSSCYVGISGLVSEIRNWQDEPKYYGGYVSMIRDFNIPVLKARSDRDLASMITKILKEKEESERPSRVTRKTTTLSQMQENVLMGVKGIGIKNAQKLLREFDTLTRVGNATEKDLIECIGSARGKRVNKVLKEEYND